MPESPYRVIFFGTSDFSVPILERLHASDAFDVVEAVTRPDRAFGRHRVLQQPPVKRLAETRGIPVFQPEKLRTKAVLNHFKSIKPDVFVVVSYGKILPKELLEIPARGAVNIHASFLPKYRGASPVAGAIIGGERMTGVTIMRMNEKMDEGPTLAFSPDIPIEAHDTRASLSEKLQEIAAEMIAPTLMEYLEGRVEPKPQDESKASVTPILHREDGLIDWSAPAEEIDRRIRGLHPWPGTYTFWGRNGGRLRLAIKKADLAHASSSCALNAKPGRVSRGSDGSMHIECGRGCMTLTLVQLEGKKEADGLSFLNGHSDIVGQTLG